MDLSYVDQSVRAEDAYGSRRLICCLRLLDSPRVQADRHAPGSPRGQRATSEFLRVHGFVKARVALLKSCDEPLSVNSGVGAGASIRREDAPRSRPCRL